MRIHRNENLKHWKIWLLILVCMVAWSGIGTVDTAQAAASGMIRVKLTRLGNPSSITMKTTGSYSVNGQSISSGSTVKVSASGSSIALTVNGSSMGSWSSLTLKRGGTGTSCGVTFVSPSVSNLYCGDLTFTAASGKLTTVIRMYIETYLYGVVAYEMSNSFPLEALKAQAVAARTYAMRNQKTSGAYDVTDSTSHQVFRGYNASYGNVIAAVNGTKGVCLTYGGAYILCAYTASNGGYTVSNSSVWGSAALGYLPVKEDPYDLENPNAVVKSHRVPKNPDASDPLNTSLKNALHSALGLSSGTTITKVVSMEPHSEKYGSNTGTYQYIRFTVQVSENGVSRTVSGNLATYDKLQGLLSLNTTSSALETVWVDEKDDCFYIRFRRYGHGIGMSQRGAQWMARQYGKNYQDILNFYYTGAKLVTLTLTDTSSGTSQGTQEENPYGEDALYYGCTGAEVKKLQTRLKELGYFTGNVGGNYLDLTVAAVMAFQRDHGLEADGIATKAVQALLYSDQAEMPENPGQEENDSPYKTLQYGDTGEAVRKLQAKLKELGYFTGNLGGNYLDLTMAAVKKYQKAKGLPQDGIATAQLQEMLFAEEMTEPTARPTVAPTAHPTVVPTAKPTVRPTAAPEESEYETLQYGDRGEAVKKLQAKLKELGYFSGNLGGNYLDLTMAAVKRYQKAKGLPQDGIATAQLQEMLFAEETVEPTARPTVAPTARPTAVPTAKPTARPTAAPGESEYETLQYGDRGEAVKKLQKKLKELGYFSGNLGGNYLDLTMAAVKKYQKAKGLPQDGIATAELQEMLFSDHQPAATARPTAKPTAQPTKKPAQSESSSGGTLSPGDTGAAVKKLQKRLQELGYFSGSIGGNYKTLTTTAVKSFQKKMQLSQTGVADQETQTLLYASGAPKAGATLKSAYARSGGTVMRKTASTSGKSLCTIPAGAKVKVLCKMSGWTRIEYNDMVGYVPVNDLTARK